MTTTFTAKRGGAEHRPTQPRAPQESDPAAPSEIEKYYRKMLEKISSELLSKPIEADQPTLHAMIQEQRKYRINSEMMLAEWVSMKKEVGLLRLEVRMANKRNLLAAGKAYILWMAYRIRVNWKGMSDFTSRHLGGDWWQYLLSFYLGAVFTQLALRYTFG